MKAIVETDVLSSGDVGVKATYIDANTIWSRGSVQVSITGITDNASLMAATTAAVLADAVLQGYTMTASDIIPYQHNPYPETRTFANPTRTLNSAFQVSTTKDASVSYSLDIALSLSLLAGQKGKATLQYADDSGFTTNVVSVSEVENGASGILGLSNNTAQNLVGIIPAGKYVKIVTANVVGSPTFTFRRAQEVLL